MENKVKARVMDASKIRRVLYRMATEIVERNRILKNVVIVGIRTRGIDVGKRISQIVREMEGIDIPVGVLDITPFRDDIPAFEAKPSPKKTRIDFPVARKDVLLVDDVLFTGRTIRAAMDGVFNLGRPRTVQLLVLIDRGHRELPIHADYIGKLLPSSRREIIQVRLREMDGRDEVLITEPAKLG
jgi:pyrimidine operon attenuation protein / uracil phosphoribosyltransferase